MNETLQVIERRKSTRAYSDEPIRLEEKEQILHAAFRAPTAGNMMLYTIIEVADQALKDRLAVTCDNQPFIAAAPLVLLFLADYQRWYDYYLLSGVKERCRELDRAYREPQVGDLLLAACDALIAAQNAVIAAESLGIGSCYIGDILEQYEVHRDLFHLPQYVLPVTLLCFGRPRREQAGARQTPRFDPRYVCFQNTYRHLEGEELAAMFAEREQVFKPDVHGGNGSLNFGQANFFRKFTADFSIEMSRSVRKMIADWEG